MYLRNHSGHQWRTIEYLPTYLIDAEKPSGHNAKGWGEGDGEGEGPQNLRDP